MSGTERTPFESLENCLKKKFGESILTTCFDAQAQELAFKAEVTNNQWFAIGFGSSMKNADMISWSVIEKQGTFRDLYSEAFDYPQMDTVSNLVEEKPAVFDEATGKMTFLTRRALDTGDTDHDYVVSVG